MIKLFFENCTKDNEHSAAKNTAEHGFHTLFGRSAVLSHASSGEPYFDGEDDVYVSISHSVGRCLAVISDHKIGADIELMKGVTDRHNRIAERFFTSDELEYVKKDPYRNFYEIWCKKESYVKYTGEGFSRHFNSFSVLDPEGVSFVSYVKDGYMVAVCSQSGEMPEEE